MKLLLSPRRRRPRLPPDLGQRRRSTPARLVAIVTAIVGLISGGPASAISGGMHTVKDLPDVISSATAWLTGIAFLVATFFLTLGGIRRMLAAGDPSEVEKSKEAFKSAGIGYALAVLAPVLAQIAKGILGA
jgi:hypothetical protein